MTIFVWILIVLLILVVSLMVAPVFFYLCVKWGTTGFYKAKEFCKRKRIL